MVFNAKTVQRSRLMANPDRLKAASQVADQQVSFLAGAPQTLYQTTGAPTSGDDNRVHKNSQLSLPQSAALLNADMQGVDAGPGAGMGNGTKHGMNIWTIAGILLLGYVVVRYSAK